MLQNYGTPYLIVHRAKLSKLLLKQAKEEGVMVQFGSVIQGFDFSKPSVLIQDGKIQEAGLIIGADGERSFCRSALPGHPEPPKPSGDIVFRTVVSLQTLRRKPGVDGFCGPSRYPLYAGPKRACSCVACSTLFSYFLTTPALMLHSMLSQWIWIRSGSPSRSGILSSGNYWTLLKTLVNSNWSSATICLPGPIEGANSH